jgi:hypothetical protein
MLLMKAGHIKVVIFEAGQPYYRLLWIRVMKNVIYRKLISERVIVLKEVTCSMGRTGVMVVRPGLKGG